MEYRCAAICHPKVLPGRLGCGVRGPGPSCPGPCHGLGAVGGAELGQYVGHVLFDRSSATTRLWAMRWSNLPAAIGRSTLQLAAGQRLGHARRPGRSSPRGAPASVGPQVAPGGCSLPRTPISHWLDSHIRLAWPSPRSLARHDCAAQEELAAPDSPRLPPLPCSGQAGGPPRALPAQSLGRLHVIRQLGEEQPRFIRAGQVRTEARNWQQRREPRRWRAAVLLARPAPVTLAWPACG